MSLNHVFIGFFDIKQNIKYPVNSSRSLLPPSPSLDDFERAMGDNVTNVRAAKN